MCPNFASLNVLVLVQIGPTRTWGSLAQLALGKVQATSAWECSLESRYRMRWSHRHRHGNHNVTCCVCHVEKCNHSKHFQTLLQYITIQHKTIRLYVHICTYIYIIYSHIWYIDSVHVASTNDINWNDHVRRWTTLQFWIAALRAEVPQTENLPKMPSGMKKIESLERQSQTEGISFNKDSGWAGHPFTGCWGASMVHRALGYVASMLQPLDTLDKISTRQEPRSFQKSLSHTHLKVARRKLGRPRDLSKWHYTSLSRFSSESFFEA